MATSAPGNECPKDIDFNSLIVDLCCHPNRDVIAAGDIDGDISVYSYSVTDENHLLLTLPHHKKAIRAIRFSPSGTKLLSASKDKSIQVVDMTEGKVVKKLEKAHDVPLYSLLVVNENIVASGDDDGELKVWDLRQNKTVMQLHECEEFISDMCIDNRGRVLLATSGDGSLSAYDIRHHKLKVKSETFDSEFLSCAIVKEQKKCVCGDGEGVLNIFNWDEWGNISDRYPGHPSSVDCMLPVSDDVIITGSSDGFIRAVHIVPNRLLGLVGQHDGFPVENLTRSHCKRYLASCSHDQKVKFWDVDGIERQMVDAQEKPKRTFKRPQGAATSDFFADLDDTAQAAAGSDDDDDGDISDGDSDSDVDDVSKTSKPAGTGTSGSKAAGTSAQAHDSDSSSNADDDAVGNDDSDGGDDDSDGGDDEPT